MTFWILPEYCSYKLGHTVPILGGEAAAQLQHLWVASHLVLLLTIILSINPTAEELIKSQNQGCLNF